MVGSEQPIGRRRGASAASPNPSDRPVRQRGKNQSDISAKLGILLQLANLNEQQFAQAFNKTNSTQKRTALSWLGFSPIGGELHAIPPRIPDQQKLGLLGEFFGEYVGLKTLPPTLWLATLDDFRKNVAELRAKKAQTALYVPVARRLGYILPDHAEAFRGKYVLYRYSFLDTGKIVSEIFTLQGSAEDGYMNATLRSYPEKNADYEMYSGRFFRYGKMYWMIITYTMKVGKETRDLMRVIQFPDVDQAKDIYVGLVTADSDVPTEAVAVRALAKKISPDVDFVEADDKQIALIQIKGEAPLEFVPIMDLKTILPILSNRVGENRFVLRTNNKEIIEDLKGM